MPQWADHQHNSRSGAPIVPFSLFYLANLFDSGNSQPSGQMVSHRPPLSLERYPFRSEQKGATNRAITCSATQTHIVWPHPSAPWNTPLDTLSQTGKVTINLPASVPLSPQSDFGLHINKRKIFGPMGGTVILQGIVQVEIHLLLHYKNSTKRKKIKSLKNAVFLYFKPNGMERVKIWNTNLLPLMWFSLSCRDSYAFWPLQLNIHQMGQKLEFRLHCINHTAEILPETATFLSIYSLSSYGYWYSH